MRSPRRFVSRLVRRAAGSTTTDTATGTTNAQVAYAPRRDGHPDPGEVVWGWVPYEEDASLGKDRPVLLIGRRGRQWLGLMLTSKDHDRDVTRDERAGRHWMDVGTGDWDRERRPSEVRLDRLIVLDENAIRREGAALGREIFDQVIAAARSLQASASWLGQD